MAVNHDGGNRVRDGAAAGEVSEGGRRVRTDTLLRGNETLLLFFFIGGTSGSVG